MIEMVEGGDAAKVFEMTKRPTYQRPTPTHERPKYDDRRPPTSFFSSSRPETKDVPLEIITERAKQELKNPFKDLMASQSPRPVAGQSYSYFNMNVNPKTNFSVLPTLTTSTTTTTERQREELSRPDFTEVHRAPFFKGLNLENPFKNEFDADFEMTKHIGFPSFASQLDYDYNPYDSTPVRSLPPRPLLVTAEKTKTNVESFSEEDLGSDMPQPDPSPPSEFLIKIPHPAPLPQPPLTTERTVYRTNYQQSPFVPPTIETFEQVGQQQQQQQQQKQQQFPRSLSYFEQQDKSRVLPTTAYVFANEQVTNGENK